MRLHTKITLATTALMLAFSGAAIAAPKYAPDYEPDPAPAPPTHAKAHGFHCKGFSKKHVKGEKGTPFSQCVKALARAKNQEHMAPGRACKGFSKKHVKGEKGTPFSQCVKRVVRMRQEQRKLAAVASAAIA